MCRRRVVAMGRSTRKDSLRACRYTAHFSFREEEDSRVGRGHKWVSAVINVQESSLRAFEQNVSAALHRFVEQNHSIGHKRLQVIARGAIGAVNRFEREWFGAECAQNFVVLPDFEF